MIELLAPRFPDYELLDCGGFEKIERFGEVVLIRPEPQAVWQPAKPDQWHRRAHARFEQEGSHNGRWQILKNCPESWELPYRAEFYTLRFKLALTRFKHVGVFPEQATNWDFIYDQCQRLKAPRVLNLFAYTGGASLAARAAGASVTHVDSVKQVVGWAKDNMALSELEDIRWIVDDAVKFAEREARRGSRYGGILLDPPAFGHGAKGERWQLEDQIDGLMGTLAQLLNPDGCFLVFNAYSLGFSALLLENLLRDHFKAAAKNIRLYELYLASSWGPHKLPAGITARLTN